ncbi:MAG: CoA-binding protein [Cyclobacteriaceae bacterium]|nr:CoA-binding protein [Cyclobacteriaceae bacterium]
MGLGTSLSSDISMNTRLSAEERNKFQNSETVRKILNNSKTIAIVGLSDKKERASNFVGSYLKSERYTIIPVNPMKQEILGEKCYPDLASIPGPVDVVDIFRKPEECLNVVKEAIAIKAKAVWLQLGVINVEAAELAQQNGLLVIMDRCLKMEHGRYIGNLHWAGMNTEIITSRKVSRFI